MAQVAPGHGLSVEDVLERLLDAIPEPLPSERASLADALGRIVAEPLQSSLDLPRWDNSAMDGYAVRASDVARATAGEPVRLLVAGESRAGHLPDAAVRAGTAVRIATGAPMPDGADAVVPVELTRALPYGDEVEPLPPGRFAPDEPLPAACLVYAPVELGASVRYRGEDVTAGSTVIESGARVSPAHVALAAAVGANTLAVHRRPIVAILATGDEIAPPGQELGPAQIPDSNRAALLALCAQEGVETLDLGIASDLMSRTIETIAGAVARADVVVATGGVSAGPYDLVRAAFEAVGRVDLWRVAIQPGRPFAFGVSNPREDGRAALLFGLPGNPVSTFVTFELFVRPALRRLAGATDTSLPRDGGVLGWDLEKRPGRRQYLRVVAARDERGDVVRDGSGRVPLSEAGAQGSHVLSALAAADALAVIPESVERLDGGSEVEMLWLPR